MHTFLRKARHDGRPCVYRFDAGPHDFSGVHASGPLGAILARLGVADRLDWRWSTIPTSSPTVPSIRRAIGGPNRRRLGRQSRVDASGLIALFEEIKAISEGMYASGADNGGIPGLPRSADALHPFARNHPLAVQWMDRPLD